MVRERAISAVEFPTNWRVVNIEGVVPEIFESSQIEFQVPLQSDEVFNIDWSQRRHSLGRGPKTPMSLRKRKNVKDALLVFTGSIIYNILSAFTKFLLKVKILSTMSPYYERIAVTLERMKPTKINLFSWKPERFAYWNSIIFGTASFLFFLANTLAAVSLFHENISLLRFVVLIPALVATFLFMVGTYCGLLQTMNEDVHLRADQWLKALKKWKPGSEERLFSSNRTRKFSSLELPNSSNNVPLESLPSSQPAQIENVSNDLLGDLFRPRNIRRDSLVRAIKRIKWIGFFPRKLDYWGNLIVLIGTFLFTTGVFIFVFAVDAPQSSLITII
ncbi:hypothetical protein ROZALSC1DRAFT_28814, partial [Rozella allomycis CSF55]